MHYGMVGAVDNLLRKEKGIYGIETLEESEVPCMD
jgi:hypothetical protein